ncbi:MAG: M56 family metallopeptidase [Nostocaceae cyanobacterium]|nr:M56 family metallopeptidase [Nostocaceae cyanobacterium]
MHYIIIVSVLVVAWWSRCQWTCQQGSWSQRYSRALSFFLCPPFLILMTAIALLCMGTQGKMGGFHTGWLSYLLAVSCLIIAAILWVQLALQGWESLQSARSCPALNLAGKPVRLLNTQALFAAQIGFWRPELVVSQGLLQSLDEAHLETVLAHEQGHSHYHDTFWFFWLGWIRKCTAWLPNTEPLWQELLVLRELRADNWAASQVDPLLLAESLLLVVSTPVFSTEITCAALDCADSRDRLEERIDALLGTPQPMSSPSLQSWNWLLLTLLPLVTVLFHN